MSVNFCSYFQLLEYCYCMYIVHHKMFLLVYDTRTGYWICGEHAQQLKSRWWTFQFEFEPCWYIHKIVERQYPSYLIQDRKVTHSVHVFPIQESELLEYVDNEDLPPMLLDLLDQLPSSNSVFYSGCVILEIRDYRRRADGSHDTKYVLLRPTPYVSPSHYSDV